VQQTHNICNILTSTSELWQKPRRYESRINEPKNKSSNHHSTNYSRSHQIATKLFDVWMPPCELRYHKFVHKSQELSVLIISPHIGQSYYHTAKQISKILLSIDSTEKKSHMKTEMRFTMASLAVNRSWWSYRNNLSKKSTACSQWNRQFKLTQ
jgi:hypothetical protein